MTSEPLRPYAAYLRVYEPLTAFPDDQRDHWRGVATRAGAHTDPLVAEHRQAMANLLCVPPRPVPVDEVPEAFVLEMGRDVLVCPVQTRLRSWVALAEFRDGLPESLVHAFVPPAALARAEADHDAWGTDGVTSPLRILTATWAVPAPWFVPFSAGDRSLELDHGPATLVYRVRMSAARRRVGRALRTLQRTLGDVGYADELEELGGWLEEFHARSWVELDYGGLARLFGVDELREDSSAEEVRAALDALAAGDEEAAEAAHGALVERWSRLNALEHAN